MDLDPVEPMERVGIFPFLLLADTLTLLQSAGQVMPTYPHLILKCPPSPGPVLWQMRTNHRRLAFSELSPLLKIDGVLVLILL